jgi:hypothetical protein
MKQITEEMLAQAGCKSIHPVAELFPIADDDQYKGLVQSIKENGQQVPIHCSPDGILIDGRNRLLALSELGLPCKTEKIEPKDVTAWIVNANLHRRHLTSGQRAMIAEELCKLKHGGDHSKRSIDFLVSETIDSAAKKMNVGDAGVQRARRVRQHAPELVEAVKSGHMSLDKAVKIADTRRRASKTAKQDKEPRPSLSEMIEKLPGGRGPIKFLTPKEFDPDFKGTNTEFVSKNGFVLLETKAERDEARALSQISSWIGEGRKLKTQLAKFLAQCPINQAQVDGWVDRLGPEKAERRRAEITELMDLLSQAAGCIK